MDRFRRVWLHLSVRFGSRLRRRPMPGYSLLSVVKLCLHLVKVSVLIELWIGGNPLLEAGISLIATLIGGFIGFQSFCLIDWPHLIFMWPTL